MVFPKGVHELRNEQVWGEHMLGFVQQNFQPVAFRLIERDLNRAVRIEDYLHRLRSSRIIFTADGKRLVRLRSIREALRKASRRRAVGSISTSRPLARTTRVCWARLRRSFSANSARRR